MKGRLTIVAILLVGAAGALGWVRGGSSQLEASEEISDRWENRLENLSVSNADIMLEPEFKFLIESDFFPQPDIKSIGGIDRGSRASLGSSAPFPEIAGSAMINGQGQVYVIQSGKIRVLRKGDILESEWEILSVDMDHVVAQRGDDTTKFPIVDYK